MFKLEEKSTQQRYKRDVRQRSQRRIKVMKSLAVVLMTLSVIIVIIDGSIDTAIYLILCARFIWGVSDDE